LNVLDRINKIDKIEDDENPDNPVNPVKKDYQHKAICGESVENVANVKMLPITNTNSQLGNMGRGTGDGRLEIGKWNWQYWQHWQHFPTSWEMR
jgi:hypothetical protein